jgi:transcriptional regulator with XRE-family HTH domain
MVESLNTVTTYNSKFSSVKSKKSEKLADYVRRVRAEKGLSTTDVEKRSGFLISDSYVTRIENGYVKNVSLEKLHALARGLGVPPEQLIAIARGKSPDDDPDFIKSRFAELALKFDRVPEDKRVNVEALVQLLDRELDRLTE